MSYFDWLTGSLREKLAERVVGEPVALRGYVQIADDHGLLIPALAATVVMAETWFESVRPTVYAQGDIREGSVSVLAAFTNGRIAVLSSDLVRPSTALEVPSVDLILIGNHGTMQFSDQPGNDGVAVDIDPSDHPAQRRMVTLIENSLRKRIATS